MIICFSSPRKLIPKGVSHYHTFGRDSKAVRGVRKLCCEKREGYRCPLIEGYWCEEAGVSLEGGRASYVFALRHIWLSLISS